MAQITRRKVESTDVERWCERTQRRFVLELGDTDGIAHVLQQLAYAPEPVVQVVNGVLKLLWR